MTQPPSPSSLVVFALTRGGAVIARRVAGLLGGSLRLPDTLVGTDHGTEEASDRPAEGVELRTFARVGPALREAFTAPGTRALVCVMATGVVVRSLAPVLENKRRDPAVLVLDEAGRFVIPLLSGHLGGANSLARSLAEALRSQVVLTTSSDVQGLRGPDLLARELQADPADAAPLLAVTSALVNDGCLDLWFDPEELGGAADALRILAGYQPRPLSELTADASQPGIVISTRSGLPTTMAACLLRLIPRWVVAGVGCKRGTSAESLLKALGRAFATAGRDPKSLRALASARLKADEPGLAAAAERLGVPLLFAEDSELAREIERHGLGQSAFVKEQAGVGAVAEPAALWAAGPGGRLLLEKQAAEGVTVSLALADGGLLL